MPPSFLSFFKRTPPNPSVSPGSTPASASPERVTGKTPDSTSTIGVGLKATPAANPTLTSTATPKQSPQLKSSVDATPAANPTLTSTASPKQSPQLKSSVDATPAGMTLTGNIDPAKPGGMTLAGNTDPANPSAMSLVGSTSNSLTNPAALELDDSESPKEQPKTDPDATLDSTDPTGMTGGVSTLNKKPEELTLTHIALGPFGDMKEAVASTIAMLKNWMKQLSDYIEMKIRNRHNKSNLANLPGAGAKDPPLESQLLDVTKPLDPPTAKKVGITMEQMSERFKDYEVVTPTLAILPPDNPKASSGEPSTARSSLNSGTASTGASSDLLRSIDPASTVKTISVSTDSTASTLDSVLPSTPPGSTERTGGRIRPQ